jgi:hypothetical protein
LANLESPFFDGAWSLAREYNGKKRDPAMLKATLQKGVIVPLEPLPPEWEA